MHQASPRAVHPQEKSIRETPSIRTDFGPYQTTLLIVTQLSYFPVTASLLNTSFFKPPTNVCVDGVWNASSLPDGVFRSLLFEWSLACSPFSSTVLTSISTVIMLGALTGSCIAGFLSDRFGRKPVTVGSMVLLSACNAVLLAGDAMQWFFSLPAYFILGASCGAYMTTNLVLVVESLCSPSSRLVVVAVNGWPLSISLTAGLCWLVPHWFGYHCVVSVLSLTAALSLYLVADESLRWLASQQREARFSTAATRLARLNGKKSSTDVTLFGLLPEGRPHPSAFSYSALLRMPSLRGNLIALCYCFFVSSIVSFGFYFNIDVTPGSRYVNLSIMGIGKFVLGLIPLLVSGCVSRKRVAIASVALATTCVWALVGCVAAGLSPSHTALRVFSLGVAASLDPTWKVSHLYSTELFPTNVRNSARGLCNAAGRLGSVLAPLAVHLRESVAVIPFSLFAVLLSVQLLVIVCVLPEMAGDGEAVTPSSSSSPSSEKEGEEREAVSVHDSSTHSTSPTTESAR